MSQNIIFGGEPSQFALFKLLWTTQDTSSKEELSTPTSAMDSNAYVC